MDVHQPVEASFGVAPQDPPRRRRRRYWFQAHLLAAAFGVSAGIIAALYLLPGHGPAAPVRMRIVYTTVPASP